MPTLAEVAAAQDAETEFLRDEIRDLRENLDRLDSFVDRNWKSIFGGGWDEDEGPSLEQLHEVSRRLVDLRALNVHVGNGCRARTSYVWKGGIHYDFGLPKKPTDGEKRRAGRPAKTESDARLVQERIESTVNQENFFDSLAQEEREASLYTTGIALYIGNDDDFTLAAVSLLNITDDLRNPNKADEVWAYRHTWTDHSDRNKPMPKSEWVYRNAFIDKRKASTLNYNGVNEPVAMNKRIFGRPVNKVTGWAYGMPDVLSAAPWAERYRVNTEAGEKVTQTMARLLGTHKTNTEAGAQNAAVKGGNATQAGGMAAVGQNNDITMLSTAGNAYDFSKLLPLLGNFAAGIGVSVIDVSASPGNAGGSYGAARSLTPLTEAMTDGRRKYHIALEREVLIWFGADKEILDVWFDPIVDLQEQYRGTQMWGLRWGFGVYTPEQLKTGLAAIDGKRHIDEIPAKVMLPNNEDSVNRRDIDPNTSASATGGNPANGSGFTPTQGSGAKTNPTGGQDQRADDLAGTREASEMVKFMQTEQMMDLMRELMERLDGQNSGQ